MRKRLLAALCCIVMLLPFAASAETALVPQMSAWQLEESASPLRVTASAQMSAWVPFDDTMLEALNTLLSHMSVQVYTMNLSGEKWSKTALLLDSEEAVSLTQRQTENQRLLNASFLPEQTLTSAVDPTALLLGDGAALNVPGYTGEEQAWVAEAKRLMQELPTLLADWKKEESVSKKIAKSGTAKTLYTFKLGKDDAAQLGTILAGAAQNSTVKAFLSSLTFSKTQAIKLYTDAEGQVLRFAYEGQCGVTTQRKVTISWNMKDDGESAGQPDREVARGVRQRQGQPDMAAGAGHEQEQAHPDGELHLYGGSQQGEDHTGGRGRPDVQAERRRADGRSVD